MARVLAVAPALPGEPHPQERIADVVVPLLAPDGPRRAGAAAGCAAPGGRRR
jgi:alkylresorcinol/alkylpyrone synthase